MTINWSWGISADWSWGISTNWSWAISRSWGIGWSWGSIGNWSSLILDISNISRVGIKNIVGDNLDAAIGKSNTITSVGGVSVKYIINFQFYSYKQLIKIIIYTFLLQ